MPDQNPAIRYNQQYLYDGLGAQSQRQDQSPPGLRPLEPEGWNLFRRRKAPLIVRLYRRLRGRGHAAD